MVSRADLTLIRITWRGFLGRHIMGAFDLTVEFGRLRYNETRYRQVRAAKKIKGERVNYR